MNMKCTLAASAAAIALAGGFAAAQETTGNIRGSVTDATGAALSGATVTVVDEGTGQSRSTTTDASGRFQIRNLAVTGDYTVIANASGFEGERVEDLRLSLGNTTTLTFDLDASNEDVITVVGTAQALGAGLASGPSSVFGLDTLETAPVINRDIKDVVRIDPRVYLDETFVDSIQCAGANPRFNSLTVDGIRLNDNFGLNSNGYPTERIPFPYDAIDQVAVELAPFDVEYGSFTACNINAVTKAGSNEFHGSVFVDYTNDSLRGDEADDVSIDNGEFDEYRYGIQIDGPIIPDMLFFNVAYEKQEGANLFGGNDPDLAPGTSQAAFDQIVDIFANTYGYQVSGLPTSLDNEDEKLLVKLDWNIVDGHRAAFTYNYNDGFNNQRSDGDNDEIEELNHLYERGAELNSYAVSLYSDWTDILSTEFRVSYIDLQNRQNSFGAATGLGEVQITDGDTTYYFGEDDSRQSNELSYELWTYKAKADLVLGNHILTFGAEREEFDVFNLFVQETNGEFRFDSIADFAAGDLNRIIYENAAGTNNPDDGAAQFGYEINTLYVQDEWQATDRLNVIAGLRWDFYTSDDAPTFNPDFQAAYGIRNDDNLEGKSVLQPRLAFTYEATPDLSIRGGAGIFAGGNPNVWISNNYSNNGVTLFEFQERGTNIITDYTYSGGGQPLFDIPDEALAAVANAQGGGAVNALDPDFEIPNEWKFNLGMTWDFDPQYEFLGTGYTLIADVLYSRTNEAAYVLPISFERDGTAPDGRPIYTGNTNDFVLTNADDDGYSFVVSAALSKSYDFGLDWTLGYAYTDAKDVNPMTSSVAFSNFQNFTRSDVVSPSRATSDYEIAHRFTLLANYDVDFYKDWTTTFSVFGEVAEGSPFSYTYGNASPFAPNAGFIDNALLYVPTGPNDPLIESAPAEFFDYIASEDCLDDDRGSIIDRNACTDDWYSKFDLKITQNFPGVKEGHNTQAFFILENVGNFLNSDWGVRRQQGFPGSVDLVNVTVNNDGTYTYTNFRGSDADEGRISVEPSLWEIRFGLRYEF
jgi:outer membrane receptor for ferrienterochelin and colicin